MTEAALLEAARGGDEGAFEPWSSPTGASCTLTATGCSTMEGAKIKEITAFVVRPANTPDGYSRWPDRAADPGRVEAVFERFGLPNHVD